MTQPELTIILACFLLLVAAPVAAGQRQHQDPIAPLKITNFGGELFLEGETRNATEKSIPGGTETNESETFLEEGVDLWTQGYIYHPNLLDLDLTLRLGTNQQRLTINDEDRNSDGTLLGYSLSSIVLKEQPVSLRLYSSATHDIISRDFTQNTILDDRRLGAEIYTKGKVPMSLLIETSELAEEDERRVDNKQSQLFRYTVTDQRDPDRLTKLTYEHEDTDETESFGAPDVAALSTRQLPEKRDEVDVSTLLRFGAEPRRHTLAAGGHARERQGFFPEQAMSAFSNLDLSHTETFSTYYNLSFSDDQTENQKERTIIGETGFNKSLYESLDFNGRIIATDRTFETGEERNFGGFLGTDYRKKTPIGRYTMSLLVGKQREEEKSDTDFRVIVGEALTLTGFNFSALGSPDILPGTIVVMNTTRTVIFVENVDYSLRRTGNITEIRRLAGGIMADPQDILVDYQTATEQNSVFTTDHFNWSNRLDLGSIPVAIYNDWAVQNDHLESGDDPGNLDRESTRLVGIELDHEGLTLTLEREERDQELSPSSRANRFKAQYSQRAGSRLQFSAGGHVEKLRYLNAVQFEFEPGREFLDTVGGFGNLTAKIRRNAILRAQGDYRRTQGRENNEFIRLSVVFEWSYRSLDFSVEARHNIFLQESREGTSDAILFSLKRRF